jgi:hypothetical protein
LNYYKESVAYDYSLFAPRDKEKIVEMPKKARAQQVKQIKKASSAKAFEIKSKALSTVSRLFVAAVILSIACLMIFTKVQITETYDKITSADKQLLILESEKIRLNMALENKISYKNIEVAARELGMQKKEKFQVNYINISKEDKGEIIKTSKDDVLSTLSDVVSAVVE